MNEKKIVNGNNIDNEPQKSIFNAGTTPQYYNIYLQKTSSE